MSRVKSFSIPTADDHLNHLIAQAAIKNDRSESWVICQALKYYFNNGEPLTEDSSDRSPSSDEVPTLPPVELPEILPRAKKGGESPPSLDAKDFVNFE